MSEEEKELKQCTNVKMSIMVYGKKTRSGKFYFPPIVPGNVIITEKRIIFASEYIHQKSYKISILPTFKRDVGSGRIYLELPICKIKDGSVFDESGAGEYVGAAKYDNGSIWFNIPVEGVFLDPGFYFDKKAAGTYHKIVLKGKQDIEKNMRESKYGPLIGVGITNLGMKQSEEVKNLLQSVRENCTQEDLPFVLKIQYSK